MLSGQNIFKQPMHSAIEYSSRDTSHVSMLRVCFCLVGDTVRNTARFFFSFLFFTIIPLISWTFPAPERYRRSKVTDSCGYISSVYMFSLKQEYGSFGGVPIVPWHHSLCILYSCLCPDIKTLKPKYKSSNSVLMRRGGSESCHKFAISANNDASGGI